jgi:transposase-like protein
MDTSQRPVRKQITEDNKKNFLKAYKESAGNIAHACRAANIDRQTYYNYIGKFDSFKKECDNIKEENIDFAESVLMGEIKNKNMTATIFFLKTIGRNRGYIERQEMDIDGDMNLVVEFIDPDAD